MNVLDYHHEVKDLELALGHFIVEDSLLMDVKKIVYIQKHYLI